MLIRHTVCASLVFLKEHNRKAYSLDLTQALTSSSGLDSCNCRGVFKCPVEAVSLAFLLMARTPEKANLP